MRRRDLDFEGGGLERARVSRYRPGDDQPPHQEPDAAVLGMGRRASRERRPSEKERRVSPPFPPVSSRSAYRNPNSGPLPPPSDLPRSSFTIYTGGGGPGAGGISDGAKDVLPASKFGMLVSQPMVMDDGTIRTFFSLPPEPGSKTEVGMPSSTNSVDAGHLEAIALYGTDPRQVTSQGESNTLSRIKDSRVGYLDAIARYGKDPRRLIGSENLYERSTEERTMLGRDGSFAPTPRGLYPGNTSLDRPVPSGIGNDDFDLPFHSHRVDNPSREIPSQPRASRSSVRDGFPRRLVSPGRERHYLERRGPRDAFHSPPVRDSSPRRLVSPGRERHYLERCRPRDAFHLPHGEDLVRDFAVDSARRGVVDVTRPMCRGRPASPSMYGSVHRDGAVEELRMNFDREHMLAYNKDRLTEPPSRLHRNQRDGPIAYQWVNPPLSISRDGHVGPPRDAPVVPCIEESMDEENPRRHVRSSQRESEINLHNDGFSPRRGTGSRFYTDEFLSPRRAAYLDRNRGMPVNPRPRIYESPSYERDMSYTGRGDLERKYMESAEDYFEDGRDIYPAESDFKRQRRDTDLQDSFEDFPTQSFGRQHLRERSNELRMSDVPSFDREKNYYDHRRKLVRRPPRGRGGPPLWLGRSASNYCDDYGEEMDYDGNYDDGYLEGYRYEDRHYQDLANEDSEYLYKRPHRVRKFFGPHAGKGRFWHEDLHGDGEPLNAPALSEDSEDFKQQTQRAYFKFSKFINENPGRRKRYEDQGKAGTLLCLVCSRFSRPFADVHDLIMHAYNSHKWEVRAEHLGLYKALCTLMGWSSAKEPSENKVYQQISPEEAKANKDDLILWPPAVIIHNACTGKNANGQQEGIGNPEMDELLRELGHTSGKSKAVYGRQGHLGTVVVKYLATLSGLKEAERLHEHFKTNGRGRDYWLQVQPNLKEPGGDGGPDVVRVDEKSNEKRRVLYGYLALAGDLDKVDLEMRQRCSVRSKKELEMIADNSLVGRRI